jgi:hypothetical protein
MRKLLLGCFFALLLTVSSGSFGYDQGTGILYLEQTDSPAVLVGGHHTIKDLLESAKLKNVSKRPLISYRIGWVVVYPTGKDRVGLGLPVDVPAGISPGDTADVPAQGVSTDFSKEGASAVVFFVTDVHSAGDNILAVDNIWKPDLEMIEEKARTMTKAVFASWR